MGLFSFTGKMGLLFGETVDVVPSPHSLPWLPIAPMAPHSSAWPLITAQSSLLLSSKV